VGKFNLSIYQSQHIPITDLNHWQRANGSLRALAGTQTSSEHAGDEVIDVLLTVAPGTSLHVGVSLLLEALGGGVELEGPQEVVGLLELVTDGPDLVDEILDAGDTVVLGEDGLNNGVVVEGNSGAVDLTVATSVDELLDGGAGGVTVGDEGLDLADHVPGGSVESHEDTVVDLAETEELHDLLLLGGKLVDTSDTDNEGNLSLTLNKEGTGLLGVTLALDKSGISSGVLGGVGSGVLLSDGSLGGVLSLAGLAGLNKSLEDLGVTSGLLDEVLGNDGGLRLLLCPKTHQKMS
jgi:hypothetical protein